MLVDTHPKKQRQTCSHVLVMCVVMSDVFGCELAMHEFLAAVHRNACQCR